MTPPYPTAPTTAFALASTALGALAAAGALAQPANQVESVAVGDVYVSAREVAKDLKEPWAIAFLPDGRMLVTQRSGELVIVSQEGSTSAPLAGTPQVWHQGQGGLMDVALHPDFARNSMVYLTFAEAGANGTAGTALGRGRLMGNAIEGFEVIWRQQKVEGPNHFGNRIAFGDDGTLFLALGERFKFTPAQNPSNTLGTVIRLNADGSIPSDNPLVGRAGADPAIWSWGHRNIEAAAIDRSTGELWVAEMGPLGGDELNRIERGANYGWPVVSWGINYNYVDIPDPTEFPEYEDAVHRWSPVRSPSGMIVYDGTMFPEWRGDIVFGALSAGGIEKVDIEAGEVRSTQFIPFNTRIREVAQGPNGAIYLLTNTKEGPGALWKLVRQEVRPPAQDEGRTGTGG
ncbi:MAG: PQQ-dependent sugar dehydrogenase [Erythrobacter sp.]|nr:PQQ-dependent sugar dehydrogenase [Erythrobacter sp.]